MNVIEDETIDVRRYVGTFLTYWWLLLALPTIGGLVALFYSNSQEPVYKATATILVQYRGSGLSLGLSDYSRSAELATAYRRLVTARPFLDTIQLDGASISASTESGPPVLIIRAQHSDPQVAAAAAQTTAEKFIDYAFELRLSEIARLQTAAAAQGIVNVENLVGAQLTAVDTLALLESVSTPGAPISPHTRRNILLGVAMGVVVAVGSVLLLEALRDTVRFPDQVSDRFGVTCLGAIFRWSQQEVAHHEKILIKSPDSGFAESFRQVRANFQFAVANQSANTFMVTSPGPSEGKTTVMSNLAVSLAHAGQHVVAVDCDLRSPSLERLFSNVDRQPGLSNLLGGMITDFGIAIHPTEVEGVDIIPAGPRPPNPSELLGSLRMGELLDRLKREYDTVLLDTPPMLVVADASVVASQVDGVIIIVDGHSTRSSSLQASLDSIRNAHANIIGVIINCRPSAIMGHI